VSDGELADLMLSLQERGAANINLVTPTHYVHRLAPILRALKPKLTVPVVYNCGGYESVEALRALEGLIDIYLPDVKYFNPELSARYSQASDYFSVAKGALTEMLRQQPKRVFGEDGSLLSGVMVRHLVLPGCRADSIALLRALAEHFGNDTFLLSLMSQYTPDFAPEDADANLRRGLTTFEYDSVLREAQDLGFVGYLQERNSANSRYTPDFTQPTF
jgi:putative pyruvate formate lyase activating enzyme